MYGDDDDDDDDDYDDDDEYDLSTARWKWMKETLRSKISFERSSETRVHTPHFLNNHFSNDHLLYHMWSNKDLSPCG